MSAQAPFVTIEKRIDICPEDVVGGHVNNSRYFLYVGDTFADWYAALGFTGNAGPITGPLMAHLELDFLHEMAYPGTVLCRLTVARVGRSSLEHQIEIFDAARPELLCTKGKSVNVWFDRDLGSTAPWPAEVLALCWRG